MTKIIRLILVLIIFLGGCAIIETKHYLNNITFEQISSKNVIVVNAYAYEKNKGMVVYGRLIRRHGYATRSRTLPGHVDIDISDPEGKIIFKTKTNYHRKLHVRINRNYRFEYSADIPFIPSEENTVHVYFHENV